MSNDNDDGAEGFMQSERRDVLRGVAAAGSAGFIGLTGGSGFVSAQDTSTGKTVGEGEIADHISLRQSAAQSNEETLVDKDLSTGTYRNNDENATTTEPGPTNEPKLPWVYTRALGRPDSESPDTMLTISEHNNLQGVLYDLLRGGSLSVDSLDPSPSDVPHGHRRPLVAMTSAVSVTTEGADAWQPTIPAAPDHNSGRTYAEMLEAYAMSQLRDKPFHDFESPAEEMQTLVNDFNTIRQNYDAYSSNPWEWFQGVDSNGSPRYQYLFRDPIYGCDRGPYCSQVWYHDIPIGGIRATPKVDRITGIAGSNGNAPSLNHLSEHGLPFCITEEGFREAMTTRSGAEPGHDPDYQVDLARERTNWVHTGIDLASQVRDDPSYQPYLFAALEIAGTWGAPLNEKLPYHRNNPEGRGLDLAHPYIDFGAVGLLDLIARVCRNSLISAWMQKWFAHRRLRPGTYAKRIDEGGYGLDSEILESGTLQHVRDANEYLTGTRSAFLPQVYPEGAPAHPAYPSGHSVIAGACATVLKTFFQNVPFSDLDVTPKRPKPGTNGQGLTDYNGTDELTVHGEINKFASNVGLARIWAGVHYRSDHLYGMLLGKQVAYSTMYDHFTNNSEPIANDPRGGKLYPSNLPVDAVQFKPGEFSHPFPEPRTETFDSTVLGKSQPGATSGPF